MKVRMMPLKEAVSASGSPWVDPDRNIYCENGIAHVPVREGYLSDRDLPGRWRYRGRGYQRIGTMLLLRGRKPIPEEIDELTRWCHPSGILWLKGHTGDLRQPEVELLAGRCDEVVVRENGISFRFDPARVMFSQGNRDEKVRMAAAVRRNERVADMCAGIGYFAIPMAKAGACVDACEINPDAYRYLVRNTAENGVGENVKAVLGDSRHSLTGVYDRVLIGHFRSVSFLPAALRHIHEGSRLHLHTVGVRAGEIISLCDGARVKARIITRKVKKFGPRRLHMVHDLEITGVP
jgi:tRNA wybutosine-synthesizing protein 2